jgi:CRISPR/Cas system CMR-associated protein Cmr3 (group 5 of RAMP superfamily)
LKYAIIKDGVINSIKDMEKSVILMRVCDHLFIGNKDFLVSVTETLTNETGDMPINDLEHSRSDFKVFMETNGYGNAKIISQEIRNFFIKTFSVDSMRVECIGKYMIEVNCHSDIYIERMKAWEKEQKERAAKWAHDNYAQNWYSNLSTMYGGDCE